MAGKTKSGTWRISYMTKGKERREISLSSRYEKSIVSEFEVLVKLLSETERFGTRLSKQDSIRVENLPLELRNKLLEHRLIEGKAAEKIPTLPQLIKQFKATRSDVKDTTLLVDKRHCGYLLEYFGNKRIDLITYAETSKIRNYLVKERTVGKGKLEQSSANRAITTFKSIFSYAVDCGYLQQSPFAKVVGGSTEGNPDREIYISYEQIEKTIEAMGENIELAGILAFARYAGFRRGEILRLRWSDFEYQNSEHTVGIFQVNGKTGKRRVPLFSELIPHLEKIRTKREFNQEYVFAHYSQCKNVGKIIGDYIRSNSNLQLTVSEVNLALERCCDDNNSTVSQQDFIHRELGFIQKFTKHFTDFVEESGNVKMERLGGAGFEPVTFAM
jgi:integrase